MPTAPDASSASTARPAPAQVSLAPSEQARVERAIIAAQCFGLVGVHAFGNGIYLTYFEKLNVPSSWILILLALPTTASVLGTLPFAHLADRRGKKWVGNLGQYLALLGVALLWVAHWLPTPLAWTAVALGAFGYGLGSAAFASSWFNILAPLIPAVVRGRFFGRLRLSWQIAGFVFTLGAGWFLKALPGFQPYILLIGLIFFGQALRNLYYRGIPELTPPLARNADAPPAPGFVAAVRDALHLPGLLPFLAYLFLLTLVTGAVLPLAGLLMRQTLEFEGGVIVWVSNASVLGAIVAFAFTGSLVDRFGTKPAFFVCHVAYALVLVAILARAWVPLPAPLMLGAVLFAFGFTQAAASIAASKELFALMGASPSSIAAGLQLTLVAVGGTLASWVPALMLKWKLLSETWTLGGATFSAYDTFFLFNAFAVSALVVTLGLIPSVLRPARGEWTV